MKKAAIILLVGFALAISVSWFVASELISPAPSVVRLPDTTLPVEAFRLKSPSGSLLAGWHLDTKNDQGVIVLFHGIRGTRLSMFKRAEFLYEHGYSVVLIDFQAHGESSGDTMTIGYLEKLDVLAAIKYAEEAHRDEPIGVIGVSLGGASALLASPQGIDALIVESAYPDIRRAVHNRVKARLGLLSWIPTEVLLLQLEPRLGFSVSELAPIDSIASLSCPVFVISGTDDLYTTKGETEALYGRANNPKQLWVVDGVAHQDVYNERPMLYKENVIHFLEQYLIRQ